MGDEAQHFSPNQHVRDRRILCQARAAGALGGKLAGAGGGGFLLLYCPKAAQAQVRKPSAPCRPWNFASTGEARASHSRNEILI